MAKLDSLRIIVLFCPACELPMPFEDYDGSGIYIGKCAICRSEFQANQIGRERDKFEVRPKIIN